MDYLLEKIGQLEEEKQYDTCTENHVFTDEYEIKKQRLLNTMEKNQKKEYKVRSFTSVAAALALVVGLSVTTYAAVKGIQAVISEDKEKNTVTYEVNHEPDDYIPPIEITAGYLPEGYQQWEECKYSPNGEYGANGISILDAGYLQNYSIGDVSQYEEQKIGNAKAVIIERKGYTYPWDIFLFYEEEGHVIEVMGCDSLSKEEMMKVCEGLIYREAPELDPDRTYQAFSYDRLSEAEKMETAEEETISKENIKGLNESILIGDINYKVTDIKISDTVNTQLLNKENTDNYDQVMKCIQDDGTFAPLTRTVTEWNGKELQNRELGTVPMKNVEVTVQVENQSQEPDDDVTMALLWYTMQEQADGTYRLSDQIEGYEKDDNFRGFNSYDVGYELPYYFDSSAYVGSTHFFYMSLGAGETKEVHVWYTIPEDMLEQAYVQFPVDEGVYVKVK